jgi:hypothetical protein
MRGFKTLDAAGRFCRKHGEFRNLLGSSPIFVDTGLGCHLLRLLGSKIPNGGMDPLPIVELYATRPTVRELAMSWRLSMFGILGRDGLFTFMTWSSGRLVRRRVAVLSEFRTPVFRNFLSGCWKRLHAALCA